MPPKKTATIAWKSKDFLSKSEPKESAKKRKVSPASESAPKKKKTSVASDDTRGHMTIFCKSQSTVDKQAKEKVAKEKQGAITSSLSTTVKDGETLVFLNDPSQFLTDIEQKQLEKRINVTKSGSEPVIFKLQWRDRDGATVVGIQFDKKTALKLTSKLTEEQTFTADKTVWFATKESLADIALDDIDGKTNILALVPDYKGVVRVLLDGTASGTFGLALSVN